MTGRDVWATAHSADPLVGVYAEVHDILEADVSLHIFLTEKISLHQTHSMTWPAVDDAQNDES